MIVIKFNEEGLIAKYIYEIKDVVLDKNTILFDRKNYNKLLEWYKEEEIEYLFNVEEFKIIGEVDLTLHFQPHVREFDPPKLSTDIKFEEVGDEIALLKSENVDLLVSNFDLDFRLFEVECFIEDNLTIKNTKTITRRKGEYNMARTQYEQAKKLIKLGEYEREEMEYRLLKYKDRGVITQEQYDELIALMDNDEMVEAMEKKTFKAEADFKLLCDSSMRVKESGDFKLNVK